ncbi:MAG: hypothetical protein HS104_11755 [Polyangiaceae bacterium]|nr:hypothetical protein [Polyangiaceae bacterium]MCL4748546.1 hypothetical protein [Myxococcales bacterium]
MLSLEEVQSLAVNICVQFGFCLSPEAQERLAKEPPADADEFTVQVFLAEGLNPSTADRKLYRRVKAVVEDAFKASEKARGQSEDDQRLRLGRERR